MSRHSRTTRTTFSPFARRSATPFGNTTSRPSLRARMELRTIRLAPASSCVSAAGATSRAYSLRGSTARSSPLGVRMNWALLFALLVFAMVLSAINIAAVADRVNCDGVTLHREQDAPVTRAQPHSGGTFERLHIADTGFRARCSRQFAPLPNGSG